MTLLLQALNDPVIEVRVAALETFGNLGTEALGEEARPVTEAVTRDDEGQPQGRPRSRRECVEEAQGYAVSRP